MKKYKKISVFFLIVMLIGLSIVLLLPKNIDNKTYYKNLKELNYNVTYKDAFPSKTLRYAILRCVVENICNNVDEELKNSNIRQYRGNSNLVIKNAGFKQEIIAKENEVLNKADLDKIQMLYIKETSPIAADKIASLRGIEFLPNLRMFYSDSIITPEVNLSFNHNLEYLYFEVNNLIERDCDINLGTISNLKKFYFDISGPRNIANNKSLDFSNNLSLKDITVRTCGLTNVNVANNVLLENVDFSNNNLYNLNLNYNPNLKKLILFKNNIGNLNLSNVPNLESLNLNWNPSQLPNFHQVPKLKSLRLGEGRYSSIDLSILPLLEEFSVQGSINGYPINNLNINNHMLKKLFIYSTNIVNLNLINAPNLEELTVNRNKQLVGLNVDNNIKLKKISLNKNNFSSINLNNNRELEDLAIYENNFNTIDLRNNNKLKSLQIIKNNISTINLENNPNLTYLNLSQNNLTSLDLHNNNLLRELDVKNNNLESLILNAQTLTNINASNNKLSSLNLNNIGGIAGNINLKNNKLTSLDLRNFSKVYDLDVSDNLLKELYLPNIYPYNSIKCGNNKLMNVKGCSEGSQNQNIEIEVIKNKEITLPIVYAPIKSGIFKGHLVKNDELFKTIAFQKYIFKKIGTYTIDFNLYSYINNILTGKGGTVTVTVKSGEEDLFNPVISNLRTMEGYKATFTKEDYKNAISNLPTNIKKFEVDVNQLDTRVPGTKNIVTKITFSDDTEKEVVVPVEVEELTKEKYNPEIITKTVPRATEITEEEYKKLITNLPNNIQRIDVVKKADTTVVGNHEAILNVVLRNGDIKEVKIPVIVSSIMAESFEPVYKSEINYSVFENIVNLPKNAFYHFLNPITKEIMTVKEVHKELPIKGLKNFKIKIFFPDNSSREYDMPVKIYQNKSIYSDEYIFNPKNEEYLEYNNNKIRIIYNSDFKKRFCNHETFECFDYDLIPSDYSASNIDGTIRGFKGGLYIYDGYINTKRFNPGFRSKDDEGWPESFNNPSWGREEEKRVVKINKIDNGENQLVQTVTILRDTDYDGIPDIDDEDDDNDGISDEQEVLDQTDPKDSTSFKVTKICYKVKA